MKAMRERLDRFIGAFSEAPGRRNADCLRAKERIKAENERQQFEQQRRIVFPIISGLVLFGALVAVIGVIVWFNGIYYEISVPGGNDTGRIINTGLVSTRETLVLTGGFLSVMGVLIAGLTTLANHLHNQTAILLRNSDRQGSA
jgi:hypothetical protein